MATFDRENNAESTTGNGLGEAVIDFGTGDGVPRAGVGTSNLAAGEISSSKPSAKARERGSMSRSGERKRTAAAARRREQIGKGLRDDVTPGLQSFVPSRSMASA